MFEIDIKLKLTSEFVDMQLSWAFIIFNVLIRMRSPSLISAVWPKKKKKELFSCGILIVVLSSFFLAWSFLWGLIPNFNWDFTHTFWFHTCTLDVKLILHPNLCCTLWDFFRLWYLYILFRLIDISLRDPTICSNTRSSLKSMARAENQWYLKNFDAVKIIDSKPKVERI